MPNQNNIKNNLFERHNTINQEQHIEEINNTITDQNPNISKSLITTNFNIKNNVIEEAIKMQIPQIIDVDLAKKFTEEKEMQIQKIIDVNLTKKFIVSEAKPLPLTIEEINNIDTTATNSQTTATTNFIC